MRNIIVCDFPWSSPGITLMASSYVHPVMGELYAEHHSWVVQLLRRKLGGQKQALDLAQDTFVRILRNGRVPVFREPRGYLACIAGRSEVSARVISMYQKQQNPH